MWLNKWDHDKAMREGGSPDEYVICLKIWQIFVVL